MTSIVLARSLGARSYGDYILIFTIISTLLIPIQFGLSSLITRETARNVHQSQLIAPFLHWGLLFFLNWSIGAFLILALSMLALRIGTHRDLTVLILLGGAWIFLLNAMFFFSAILRGIGHSTKDQLLQNVLRPSVLLFLITVALLTLDDDRFAPRAVIVAQIMATLLTVILLSSAVLRKIHIPFRGHDIKANQRKWLRAVLLFMMIGGIDALLQNSDVLMLGVILSNDEVAIYRVGGVLAGLLSLPLSAISIVAAPKIAASLATSPSAEMQARCINLARIAFSTSVVVMVAYLLFGQAVIDRAFGAEYSGAYSVMLVLGLGSILNVAMGLNRVVLTMNGHESVVFRVLAWSTLFNVVLNAILISYFGTLGAAAATAAAIAIWNIWLGFESKRILGFNVAILSK